MNDNLTDIAISQALKGNWQEALKINKEIVDLNPDDADALNRLSRAYFELGDLNNAKKIALKVTKIDPNNAIAQRAISKYDSLSSINSTIKNSHNGGIKSSDFIEEAGTSRHLELLNICSKDLITTIFPGDELILLTHSHKVSVTTKDNKYVGRVPDDLSAKLRSLTKNGYKFKVIVKSAEGKCIKVIIKEIKRGKGFENIKSFINDSLES